MSTRVLTRARPVFKSSIWRNGPSPWEIWTFGGHAEANTSNVCGFLDPQLVILRSESARTGCDHIYIYIYIYICVYMYMCIYIYICIYIYMHICINAYVIYLCHLYNLSLIHNTLHFKLLCNSLSLWIYIYIYIYAHTCMSTRVLLLPEVGLVLGAPSGLGARRWLPRDRGRDRFRTSAVPLRVIS